MKKSSQRRNELFLEECRKIDFSADSANRERNLEMLKMKQLYIEEEREIVMKKKMRKPIMVVIAAVVSLLCLSMVVYGDELMESFKGVEFSNFFYYATDLELEDGEAGGGIEITRVGGYGVHKPAVSAVYGGVLVEDLQEAQSYFFGDFLVPSYLPEGYAYETVKFDVANEENVAAKTDASKYMTMYFYNGKDRISINVRYLDETSGVVIGGGKYYQEITINGRKAVLDAGGLSTQIGDVMYWMAVGEEMDVQEVIRMVESMK